MQKAADAETAAGNADSKADTALDAANTAAGAATAAASAASAAEESANSANTAANEAKTAAKQRAEGGERRAESRDQADQRDQQRTHPGGHLDVHGRGTVPIVERVRHGEADHRRNDQGTNAGSYVATFTPKGGLRVGRRHQDRQERDLDDQQGQPVRTPRRAGR